MGQKPTQSERGSEHSATTNAATTETMSQTTKPSNETRARELTETDDFDLSEYIEENLEHVDGTDELEFVRDMCASHSDMETRANMKSGMGKVWDSGSWENEASSVEYAIVKYIESKK